MAEAVWNGSLRLSLVSCPIYLSSTTSDAKRVRLDRLSARTGNPVTEQFVDAKTGDVVAGDALVKGYEFAAARYVTVSDDELGKLGSGVGNIIDLEEFVPRHQIDHLYVDETFYIHPDGQLAADTVHALRVAMQRSGRAALGHVRIGESERPALIEPYRGGLMMSTLRTAEELVQADFVERADADFSGDMVEIAEAIIARRAAEFDASVLRDRFQDDLRALVHEKVKTAPPAPAPERRPRLVPAPEAAPPPPPPAPEPVVAAPPPPEPPPPPPPAPEPVVAAPPPPPEPPPPAPEAVVAASPPPPPAPEPPPPETVVVVVAPPAPEPPPVPESPPPPPPPEPVIAAPPPPAPEPPPPAPEPEPEPAFVAGGTLDVGAEILLHIMGLGDRRYVEPGWAGNPGSKRQIEALSIRPRDGLAPSAIEFRVFAQEGRATAWVSNGNYAGTRGRNLPLTGFAVRPATELGERLEIAYEGSFFEGGVVGPKRNGELCVSPVADDPLEAVRITIIDLGEAAE
ncbi:MAG TPA: Ku protein [Stellaceae bacterium]|nr:Ku protein [Stellaceae bacterium]